MFLSTRMKQRRGTAAQWSSADPTLAEGEIGFETDTNKFKIGDGVNIWSNLSYFIDESSIDALPDQTSAAGKFLTTDGTTASWADAASPVPHPFTMLG